MTESKPNIEAKEHYAYVSRSAIRLFNEGVLTNVVAIDVEPEYGYTTRLEYTDGSYRITYGNDLGLNPGAAEDLAKDKGHTKFLLRRLGINSPEGTEFLLPWWAEAIGENQAKKGNTNLRTIDDAPAYIHEHLGYPVYVKPVSGSKGIGVQRVGSDDELQAAFTELEEAKSRVAIVEEAVTMPDYRVVVLDGELISAYQRVPLTVIGDGHSTIEQLVTQLQLQYDQSGRDTVINPNNPHIIRHLTKKGLRLASVPQKDNAITLVDISNLSAGGTSFDVTNSIDSAWVELCAHVASNFNLRLCGVDLACEDVAVCESAYSVLEVNSTPGLDHYALEGEAQQRIVDALYARVLNAFPSR